MTAKIVIASAARLMEVLHFWRKRKRIAEDQRSACQSHPEDEVDDGVSPAHRVVDSQTPTPQKMRKGTNTPSSPRTDRERRKNIAAKVGFSSRMPHTRSVIVVLVLSPVIHGCLSEGE